MPRPVACHCLPLVLLYCMLSLSAATSAMVRQWGEAAGFEEFGIAAPSIVLDAQDTLSAAVRLNIGDGEFVAAVHATASHSRPWGITLSGINHACQPVSVTFLSAITDTTLAFDELKSTRVIIVRETVANQSFTTVIPCKESFLKRYPTTQSMVVERHDHTWTLTLKADNGDTESFTHSIHEAGFTIETFGITVPQPRAHRKGGFGKKPSYKVEIHRATVHYTATPPMAAMTSIDALSSHFLRSTDPLEGYYRISERSFDEQYLRPGGDYVLALLRTAVGYDIIYISGATHHPSAWHTGMVHGRLTATANPMQFTASWIDARYRPIATEALMTVDGEGLITLQFPYLFSTVRLQRLDPSAIHP